MIDFLKENIKKVDNIKFLESLIYQDETCEFIELINLEKEIKEDQDEEYAAFFVDRKEGEKISKVKYNDITFPNYFINNNGVIYSNYRTNSVDTSLSNLSPIKPSNSRITLNKTYKKFNSIKVSDIILESFLNLNCDDLKENDIYILYKNKSVYDYSLKNIVLFKVKDKTIFEETYSSRQKINKIFEHYADIKQTKKEIKIEKHEETTMKKIYYYNTKLELIAEENLDTEKNNKTLLNKINTGLFQTKKIKSLNNNPLCTITDFEIEEEIHSISLSTLFKKFNIEIKEVIEINGYTFDIKNNIVRGKQSSNMKRHRDYENHLLYYFKKNDDGKYLVEFFTSILEYYFDESIIKYLQESDLFIYYDLENNKKVNLDNVFLIYKKYNTSLFKNRNTLFNNTILKLDKKNHNKIISLSNEEDSNNFIYDLILNRTIIKEDFIYKTPVNIIPKKYKKLKVEENILEENLKEVKDLWVDEEVKEEICKLQQINNLFINDQVICINDILLQRLNYHNYFVSSSGFFIKQDLINGEVASEEIMLESYNFLSNTIEIEEKVYRIDTLIFKVFKDNNIKLTDQVFHKDGHIGNNSLDNLIMIDLETLNKL